MIVRRSVRVERASFILAALALAACGGSTEPGTPDDAPEGAPEGAPDPEAAKLVFVTSEKFTGDLGGLNGADAKCKAAADSAGAAAALENKDWVAWISIDGTRAAERLTAGAGPYRLSNGTVIAQNSAGLTSFSGLMAPINLTEKSTTVSSLVWTGTGSDGYATPFTCEDFTSGAATSSGTAGTSEFSDITWMDAQSDLDCNAEYPIFCFETGAAPTSEGAPTPEGAPPPEGGSEGGSILVAGDCNSIQNPGSFQKEFCDSAYEYFQQVQAMAKSMFGTDYDYIPTFLFYQQPYAQDPVAGTLVAQTQYGCKSNGLRQVENNAGGTSIYPNNFVNQNFTVGLGDPLCDLLGYFGSMEPDGDLSQAKDPMTFFNFIRANPFAVQPANPASNTHVLQLGANVQNAYQTAGGGFGSLYMPPTSASAITFNDAYVQANTGNEFSAYWGMSGGGGSGGGFGIRIETPEGSFSVFGAGFGGGGGFSSPGLGGSQQVALNGGGGAGMQFSSAGGKFTQFTDNLGLGGGAQLGDTTPGYEWTDGTSQFQLASEAVQALGKFKDQLVTVGELPSMLTQLGASRINIWGGGGMGVGAQYNTLTGGTTAADATFSAYTPHVIGAGAGFEFYLSVTPQGADSATASGATPQSKDFYGKIGDAYQTGYSSAAAAIKAENLASNQCEAYTCVHVENSIFDAACSSFGSDFDLFPHWVKIEKCKYYGANKSAGCPQETSKVAGGCS